MSNKISNLAIGGRRLADCKIGGGRIMHSESGKRYTYYFNGVDSMAVFDPIVLRNVGECYGLCLKPTHRIQEYLEVVKGLKSYRFDSAGYSFAFRIDIDGARFYSWAASGNRYFYIGLEWAEGSILRVQDSTKDALPSTAGTVIQAITTINRELRWAGYIQYLHVNGVDYPLEKLKGVRFINVVRYELDDNDEIIESTAKVLNS